MIVLLFSQCSHWVFIEVHARSVDTLQLINSLFTPSSIYLKKSLADTMNNKLTVAIHLCLKQHYTALKQFLTVMQCTPR